MQKLYDDMRTWCARDTKPLSRAFLVPRLWGGVGGGLQKRKEGGRKVKGNFGGRQKYAALLLHCCVVMISCSLLIGEHQSHWGCQVGIWHFGIVGH